MRALALRASALTFIVAAAAAAPANAQAAQAILNTLQDVQDEQADLAVREAIAARRYAQERLGAIAPVGPCLQGFAAALSPAAVAAESDPMRREELAADARTAQPVLAALQRRAQELAGALERLDGAARAVIDAGDDPRALRTAVIEYGEAEAAVRGSEASASELQTTLQTTSGELQALGAGLAGASALGLCSSFAAFAAGASGATTSLPSIPFNAVAGNVVFTAGGGLSASWEGGGDAAVGEFGLSTNLLGKIAGTPLSGLGADALGTYFTNNITVGTNIPTNDVEGLTAQLGLGLGGLDLGALSLWPVLGITQLQADDSRVPAEVALVDTAASAWSVPTFSVALLPFSQKTIKDRLGRGAITPAIVFTVDIPYYYPGPIYDALAGLFNDNRRDFEQAGGVRFGVGVSIPLLRLGGSAQSGSTEGGGGQPQSGGG